MNGDQTLTLCCTLQNILQGNFLEARERVLIPSLQSLFDQHARHVFSGTVMAIHHASSAELIDIRPLKGNLKNAITKTLYKSDHLEVFRMILLAGKAMPAHRVAGEITVQCLEGSIEFTAAGTSQLMHEGDLICLAGGEVHALKAVENSSALVTILLHEA